MLYGESILGHMFPGIGFLFAVSHDKDYMIQ